MKPIDIECKQKLFRTKIRCDRNKKKRVNFFRRLNVTEDKIQKIDVSMPVASNRMWIYDKRFTGRSKFRIERDPT